MKRTKLYAWFGWAGVAMLTTPVWAQVPTVAIRNPVVRVSPHVAVQKAESEELDESPLPTTLAGEPEVINERFPNGDVRVQRHVHQDSEGNFINHGDWAMWDERGEMVGAGKYDNGLRHGKWVRWFRNASGKMFTDPALQAFEGPFVSEAQFDQGKLDGKWRLFDGRKRQIAEWDFKDGELHGKSLWWYPDGRKMRETTFAANQLEGEWAEWDAKGAQTRNDFYKSGRRLAKVTNNYPTGQMRDEGLVLFPSEILQVKHDWWAGTIDIKVVQKVGKSERHGPFVAWHKNGIPHWEGTYQHDLPVGKHTWWHTNGQKQAQGEYISGLKTGKWTWWYENGMKQCIGEYVSGHQNGRWTSWDEAGKVGEIMEFALDGKTSKQNTSVSLAPDQQPPADLSDIGIDNPLPQPKLKPYVGPLLSPNPTAQNQAEPAVAPMRPFSRPVAEPVSTPVNPNLSPAPAPLPQPQEASPQPLQKDEWWRLKPASFMPSIKSTPEAEEAPEPAELDPKATKSSRRVFGGKIGS